MPFGKKKDDHSSKTHPGLDRSPKKNWVDREGGLPSYVERIAKHIHADSGLPVGQAIAAAINHCRRLAAKGNVQAQKALAQWEKMKSSARAKRND